MSEGRKRDGGDMEEKADRHARELRHGSQDNSEAAEDLDTARIAARRILEESEERVHQRGAYDPESDDVIRRSTEETAAVGEDEP